MSQTQNHGSIFSYILGFLISLILTLLAYILIVGQFASTGILIIILIVLALIQLIVQLIFFLHLGQESKPRWHLTFFISAVGIILLIVIGSIWIMYHLNYNMTPAQMNQYLLNEEGIQK